MYNKNQGFYNKQKNRKMKSLWYKLFTIGLGIIIITSSSVTTYASSGRVLRTSYTGEIKDAKGDKQKLEAKKEKLKERLEQLEQDKGDILKYVEKLDKELASLSDEVEKLNTEIKKVSNELEETKKKLEAAKETEKKQYETMKKRIQYMYENGETNYLEVLLSAKNLSDLLNQAEYVEQISKYDQSLLDHYTKTKQEISEMSEKLTKDLEQKNLLNEELVANQSALETLRSDKQKEVKKYERNISETESMSAEYDKQIGEQEALIEELLEKERKRIEEEERRRKEEEERRRKEEEERKKEEAGNNGSSGGNSSGGNDLSDGSTSTKGFTWPVPSSRRITCYFGPRNRPTAGASSYHKGIDIGAPTGSNIVAAKGGTVVTSAYNVAAGNYIMISHGNGVYTVYMHCSKLLVSQGQTVSTGQVIALVGSTGISTGAHLHFGVSVNGSYVNPLNYL